jgi:capsular polysaccharide biosynthesis protein
MQGCSVIECQRCYCSNAISAATKDELRGQESIYSLEIRKISEERDRAVREVAVQQSFVDEAAERVNDLDQSSRDLKSELEAQARKYGENLARMAREQGTVSQLQLRLLQYRRNCKRDGLGV